MPNYSSIQQRGDLVLTADGAEVARAHIDTQSVCTVILERRWARVENAVLVVAEPVHVADDPVRTVLDLGYVVDEPERLCEEWRRATRETHFACYPTA